MVRALKKKAGPIYHMIAGCLTGYFGGIVFGLHEAVVQLLDQPSKEYLTPFRQIKELLFFMLLPALIYAAAFALLFALVGLFTYALMSLFRRTMEPSNIIAMYIGLFFGFAAFIFLLFGFNSVITLGILFYPPRLFFTLRNLLGCVLAGIAVRYLTLYLLKHASTWIVLVRYSFAALFSGFLTFLALLFVNRNYVRLEINSRNALILLALLLAGLGLLFFISKMLSWVLRDHFSARRFCIWSTAASPFVLGLLIWICSQGIKEETRALHLPVKHSSSPYNVILISIDTLRADYLSCYGAKWETPHIDRFAREGVLFENCHVQSPWTLTSLASMHTGMYPTVNGLNDPNKKISEVRNTLAEYLQRHNFLTQSFVTNGYTRVNFGFSQGFDRYNHMTQGVKKNLFLSFIFGRILKAINPVVFKEENLGSAENITRHAEEFLDTVGDSSFFLWLHYIDPHDPYAPPEPEWVPPEYYNGWMNPYNSGLILEMRTGYRLSGDDMEHLRNLYTGEVRYIDDKVGSLMAKLDETGLSDNTLVIITSDHGEEFWEHENILHGGTLYEEIMRVPLLIRLPGVIPAGGRIGSLVRLIDIMPTVLTLQGIPFEEYIQGKDLMPLIHGENIEPRLSFSESLLYYGEKKAVFDGRYKFILTINTDRKELYDLQEDPGEHNNLYTSAPEIAARMEQNLMEWMSSSRILGSEIAGTDTRAVIDDSLRQELQALGYVH